MENMIETFEFIGLFIAKALFDKIPLNLCLSHYIYKFLLDLEDDSDIEGLKFFDTVMYNSLKYMMENPIDDNDLIEQYFVYEHGDGTEHELAVGGKDVKVTDDNKMQYSLVKTEYLTRDIVINQLAAIKRGFNRLIPTAQISSFMP